MISVAGRGNQSSERCRIVLGIEQSMSCLLSLGCSHRSSFVGGVAQTKEFVHRRCFLSRTHSSMSYFYFIFVRNPVIPFA